MTHTQLLRSSPRPGSSPGSSEARLPALLDRVGDWHVLGELGAGGMARVYDASDARGRRAALKFLDPRFAGMPDARRRFAEELALTRRVQHAAIIEVGAAGEWNGLPYFEMEPVRGDTVHALLRELSRAGRQMPVPVAVALAIRVLRALEHVHSVCDEEGRPLAIVHRDVSPANVFVCDGGAVKLADFGIAVSRASAPSPHDEVIGKPAYAAPEQLLGEDVDRRADLYSTGVLLWEALASARLFRGESFDVLRARIFGESPVPPIRAVRRDVPPALARALDRLLATDPRARPARAADAIVQLERAVPAASAVDDAALAALRRGTLRWDELPTTQLASPRAGDADDHTRPIPLERVRTGASAAGISTRLRGVVIALTTAGTIAIGTAALARALTT